MREYILALALFVLPLSSLSQTLRDAFKSMPDSICPYLTENNRLDLLDFLDSRMTAKVRNLLGDTTVLDTISSDYAVLRATAATTMHFRLLPLNPAIGDTISSAICVLTTSGTSAPDSRISFYSPSWERLPLPDPIADVQGRLVARPDTMTEERFAELLKLVEVNLTTGDLPADGSRLVLRKCPALINKKDSDSLGFILRKVEMSWNGRKFE